MSFRRRGRRALALVLAGLCFTTAALLPAAPALAAGTPLVATVEKVEAAYLYKFLNYADWPPSTFPRPDAPYVIGVAGDDAVADELARIAAGRSVNNRGVIVKRLLPGDAVNDLHMLFVGPVERARQLQWLRQAKGRPILTVTAFDGALDQGAIINFRTVDDRVRFEVSADAAEQNDVRLSSRLFTVATNVVKGSH